MTIIFVSLALFSALGLVITIHELGHAVASIMYRVPINRAYIGISLPPRFKIKIRNVPITITPWLLAGGVEPNQDAVETLPANKKIVIFLAGPIFNILAVFIPSAIVIGPERAFNYILDFIKLTFYAVFSRDVLNNLSSPIGAVNLLDNNIATEVPFVVEIAVIAITAFIVLSISVAVINLIPFPPLDGSRVVFAILEGIFKNKEKVKTITGCIDGLGALVLALIFIYILIRDIFNLFR